ncbi:SRP72 domain-containing protein [Mycena kentingensis (nom. inval.)]|nr:SRP72 domain-containing protein [Mycena kentingensis (nom. inval.)]
MATAGALETGRGAALEGTGAWTGEAMEVESKPNTSFPTTTMPAPKPASSSRKPAHVSKPKTRFEPTVSQQIQRLFKTLYAQIDGGHHPSAIKTCDKILRLAPGDDDATQTKLFLLLTTDQPRAALELIDSAGGESQFERAYAMYSLQQREEARKALEGQEERGPKHLEAQLNYRDGAYQAALDIYNDLLDTAPTTEEHADILTNIQAASTHLEFINTTFLRGLAAVGGGAQLEDAPPPMPVASTSAIPAPAAAVPTSTPAQPKKVKLPKGVVLGVTPPPDPERWLKKSERSTFGTGKRRKGAGGGGATQGSSVDAPAASSGGGGGGGKKGKKRR